MKPASFVIEKRETMASLKRLMAACVIMLGAAGTAAAQVSSAEAEQIRVRQQIATFENVLQQAVLHGADNVYAQFRSVFQDRPRLGAQPRAIGFTVPGWGPLFVVDVPMMQMPILYEVAIREQEYRNALMQIQRLQTQALNMRPGPERDQVLEMADRLQQQLGTGALRPESRRSGPNGATLIPAVPVGVPGGVPGAIEQKPGDDPETVYSRAVKDALIDAMLENSQALGIGPDEWLTIMAMARETNNAAPGASVDSSKGTIRIKGSVLAAYRAGTVTKEEAHKQVEIKEQ